MERKVANLHRNHGDEARVTRRQTVLVSVDDAGITVLNPTDPALPRAASNAFVVETYARGDVLEVRVQRKGRGFWGHLGPIGGYFVGGMAGGYAVGATCQAINGKDRCDSGAFLGGAFFGGIAGGAYGFIASRRWSDDVVYRAP